MKKRILSLLLAAAMMLTAAPLAAFADEGASETVIGGADGPTAIYVSEGGPASVQDQIMLIQETPDLLEMVRDGQMSAFNQPAGTYYIYPEFLDYIKEADVVSIQIGMNDAMVPFVVSIGNATNWKSEQLANTIVSGGYRDMNWDDFVDMAQKLFGMRLTLKETGDLFYALTTGAAQVCNTAYDNVATYLPQIVDAIRAQNPDVQILLLGCYNPVPLLWTWSNFFNRYNRFVRNLAEQTGCTYVAIPRTQTANDGHPTNAGHKYIARQIVEAIQGVS